MQQLERYGHRKLIDKINVFNEIYMLDYLTNKDEKRWKDYLDPITQYLYNISYGDFIVNNELAMNSTPGILEMYYNIFLYTMKDLKSITIFKNINQLYSSVDDVKRTFDDFLAMNNYRVEKISILSYGSEKVKYNIYPMV